MAGPRPRLSGLSFVDTAHGVDSTRIRAFRDDPGHERSNAVRHYNSVFHDVVKRVPWAVFERLVAAHGADRRVRRLSTKSQLLALLYGQFAGAASLREIVGGLKSHSQRLYHAGGTATARTTLADANAGRPSAVFAELFAAMAAQVQGPRRRIAEAVYLVDSTSIRLSGLGSDWARFSAHACGAKSMSSTTPMPSGRSMPPSPPPRSTTSSPPRRCRSRPAPPTSSISATTTTPGGPRSMPPAAASSPA
jgi:hypothetical protein